MPNTGVVLRPPVLGASVVVAHKVVAVVHQYEREVDRMGKPGLTS